MNKKLDNINWGSFMSKAFIFSGIFAFLFLLLISFLINDLNGIIFGALFGLFFITIGIIIPIISKQNAIIATSIIFGVFSIWMIIVTGILLLFFSSSEIAMIFAKILSLLSGIFLISTTLLLIHAKNKNKLKLYKPAPIKCKMTINELLNSAVNDLKVNDEPWDIFIENNSIIAKINWKNTTNFSFTGITKEMENFEYRINLFDNYKYTEFFKTNSTNANLNPTSVSATHSSFYGIVLRDYDSIEFGINHNTKEKGIITTHFSTDEIRNKMRTYVEERGYRLK